ncbi:non-ribosomal peptide synthetase, partial [Streptomyces tendae]|uniref:non-ribosomal peptide synthetase n=1 Tax=Streptomyces tendae TaxID=1932 RepID=UPI00167B50F1
MKQQSGLEAVLSLTPLQEGMLFHALYDESAADVYISQMAVEIEGRLHVELLRDSARTLLRRHAGLRGGFLRRRSGQAVQIIPKEVRLPWEHVDLGSLGPREQRERLLRLTAQDLERRFDMSAPPLVRFTLIRLADESHVLVFTNHHILLDGWSLPLVLGDLVEIYRRGGTDDGLPPTAPFRTYLEWLAAQDDDEAESVWRGVLSGLEEPTLVAPAYGDRAPRVPQCHTLLLAPDLTSDLAATARRLDLTLNTVVQGAWALLLGRLVGRTDVVFGTTVSGRPPELPGVESMVGMLMNTLPVRVRINPAERLGAFLTRMQEEQNALLSHQHVSLAAIQRSAGLGRLFDTATVFENAPMSLGTLEEPAGGLSFGALEGTDATGGMHYPLSLVAFPGKQLHLGLNYQPDAFEKEDVAEIANRLRRLLESVAADADRPVGRIDLLSAGERTSLLRSRNETVRPVDEGTLPELFGRHVERHPSAAALLSSEEELTYAELDKRSDHVARVLVGRGVLPGDRVVLLQERSVDLVVSMLSVLKAGAAYVPLDARSPAGRLEAIIADTSPSLILSDRASRPALPHCAVPTLMVADVLAEPHGTTPPLPAAGFGDQAVAYVMYTSGSTGSPKGIAVSHRNVSTLVFDQRLQSGDHARVLFHSPQAFDASTYELWVPLLSGGSVVVAPAGELEAPVLERVVARYGVTALWLTAGLFRLWAEESPGCFAGLREVWTGGDVVPAAMVRRVLDVCSGLSVVNGYGPTETTVFATCHGVRSSGEVLGTVPIGRPMDNMRVYVLDAGLLPVPVGVAGELYIAGSGLARGYV